MKATKFSQFLQSREQLKFVDRPHWIYLVEAAILCAIIVLVGFIGNQFIAQNIIYPRLDQNAYADGFFVNVAAWVALVSLWGPIIFATIYFLNRLIFWASTYIFASDRRLFMKTGLLRVLVNEVSFDEIRKMDINYGLLGRLLGYGKLMMDARFVEDTDVPYIYYPEQFSKLIHYSNDLDGDVNLSYVTNGMKGKADQIVSEKSDVHDQVAPMREQAEFAEHAFTDKEQKELEADRDEAHQDFEDAVHVPDKSLDKPASSTVPKVNV